MKFIKVIKANELPDILKEYQLKLAEEIYQADIKFKSYLIEERNRLGHSFYTDPRYNKVFIVNLMGYNSETLKNLANKQAEGFVQKLWDKINTKINNIESVDLHINGRDLSGMVRGDNCDIRIETILAGGPIQRLHNRCLFKVLKKKDK